MKKWFNIFLVACTAALMVTSCKKDETKTIAASAGTKPTLTADNTTLVLVKDSGANNAVTFASTIVDFGYDAVVTYTLQFDKIGNNFTGATMRTVTMAAPAKGVNKVQTTLTVDQLNDIAVALELTAYVKDSLEVRVQAKISDYYAAAYSDAMKMYITSFRKETYLWVPGDYQGWSPPVAPQLYSPTGNGVHVGFIYFAAPPTFKITSAADWNHTNYGDAGGGKISTTGGDIKTITAPGNYQLTADINPNALTLKAVLITRWAVIGDAVGGWTDANEKALTFDAATKTYKGTIAMTAAGMKFRANTSWDINLGDSNNDKSLEFGGGNIAITDAGTYDVVLDLNTANHLTYTLTKK